MEWKSYAEAFAHYEHKVCGRVLRPFCAYYRMWLRIIESPLVVAGKPIGVADLEMAARLCSCDYGQAERVLGRKPGRMEKWWRAMRWLRRGAFEREAKAMLDYMEDTATGPDYAPGEEGKSAGEDFPLEVLHVAMLVKNGVRREEAWMMPWGESLWMRAAITYMESGKTEVLTPESMAIIAAIKEEERRKAEHRRQVEGQWSDEKVFAVMLGEEGEDAGTE